jgi:hypothetical protein
MSKWFWKGNKIIKLEEKNSMNLSKIKDNIELTGNYNDIKYLIRIFFENGNCVLRMVEDSGKGWSPVLSLDTEKTGGSVHQAMAQVFNHLKIKIPKSDTTSSGLDINHMIEVLIKKYKFEGK